MEKVIDELEMISSPLAESEDSLISEMSTRNDVAKASWMEFRRRKLDGNESDFEEEDSEIYGPPPVPEKDYARNRSQLYRKRGEEFPMRRSRSFEKPARPRTPTERKWTRNIEKARNLNHIYATPVKNKNAPKILEFEEEVPRYVKPRQMVREDSLTSLLKKQLAEKSKKSEENEEKEEILPEYVEPKDPIIKELQEFLKIEPKSSENSGNSTEKSEKDDPKPVEAVEHRLIVRGWQELLKSSSSSSTSSTNSTTV